METRNQETSQAEEPEKKTKPIWEAHVGAFQVSIWEKKREINGRSVPVRNVALTKRFRGRDGEFRSSTSYLMENELPKVIVGLHDALKKMSYSDFESNEEEAQ